MEFNWNGKPWTITFVQEMPHEPPLPDDRCGDTIWANRAIRVKDGRSGKETLETIVHELMHASLGQKATERRVENIGALVGGVLWRLGYRRRRR